MFLSCTPSIPEGVTFMQDLTTTGRKKDWAGKKQQATKLAESYLRLGWEVKAQRVSQCGEYLLFAECPNDGHKKLVAANLCRDRLCPICSWRRSDLIFKQLLKILGEVPQEEYGFLLLTLTVKNVSSEELAPTLDKLAGAWNKLSQRKEFKQVKGWFRALEVTRNKRHGNYHPHFHVLMVMPKSYFEAKAILPKNAGLKHGAQLWSRLYADC